ncbi:polysaccharide deacetylase family protein, partial [Candidatus Pelagibacter sp.]|nr:polysaccharide deacetylase family protein [Candidatus Pelagibacter sp.]
IDDGYSSFFENAWPYLRDKKIPFILFISTREVGKKNYMNWSQIKEIQKSKIGFIGNHSHSHEYLVDFDKNLVNSDINKSIEIFKKKLGYNPIFFSYPFGEYNKDFIKIIKKNFSFAFGQHSGVIDLSKNKYQLPRFPINEKYGDLNRFKSVVNLLPFYYKSIIPQEKYLSKKENPPNVLIEFFPGQKNIKNISCYSNEQNKWGKTKIHFQNETSIKIILRGKFTTERGRINCSLNDKEGWRWLGIQFVIKEN